MTSKIIKFVDRTSICNSNSVSTVTDVSATSRRFGLHKAVSCIYKQQQCIPVCGCPSRSPTWSWRSVPGAAGAPLSGHQPSFCQLGSCCWELRPSASWRPSAPLFPAGASLSPGRRTGVPPPWLLRSMLCAPRETGKVKFERNGIGRVFCGTLYHINMLPAIQMGKETWCPVQVFHDFYARLYRSEFFFFHNKWPPDEREAFFSKIHILDCQQIKRRTQGAKLQNRRLESGVLNKIYIQTY